MTADAQPWEVPLFPGAGEPLWRLPVAAAVAGASYRQADHWISTGALRITIPADGSGSQRLLTRQDVAALCRIVQLREVGIPLAKAAHPDDRLEALVDENDVEQRLLRLDALQSGAHLGGRTVVMNR